MESETSRFLEKGTTGIDFSSYGEFVVLDKLELHLPQTEIKIERRLKDQFSYYRKNSEDQIKRMIIPTKEKELKIELAPILPLNLPAKKTNDLMFLRLVQSVFVEKQSKIEVLVQFPIEIGVFLKDNKGTTDFFDCFTCEPMHSRFALYGTPESGNLCMYSKVTILEKDKAEPYVFAIMKVNVKNNLDEGVSIGKLVFPVTYHDIYYKNQSSEAHIDDISAVLEKSAIGKVLKIKHEEYSKGNMQWKLAPRADTKGEKQQFIMTEGFD